MNKTEVAEDFLNGDMDQGEFEDFLQAEGYATKAQVSSMEAALGLLRGTLKSLTASGDEDASSIQDALTYTGGFSRLDDPAPKTRGTKERKA